MKGLKMLKPGSKYDIIFQYVVRNPGCTENEISGITEIPIGELGPRLVSLERRRYLAAKTDSVKLHTGGYAMRKTYYVYGTESLESLSSVDLLDRPHTRDDYLTKDNWKYAYNCMKVAAMVKKFDGRLFVGNGWTTSRDLAKEELFAIDRSYRCSNEVDRDIIICATYLPVVNTMEDQYLIGFNWYFRGENMGRIYKVSFNEGKCAFTFTYKNKTLTITHNSYVRAGRAWREDCKKIDKLYEKYMKEPYEIGSIGAPIDDLTYGNDTL